MKRILVVDDNIVILRQIQIQLSGIYEVMLARSGELALTMIRLKRPDLILLDVEMPGMDGFQVFEKIREQPDLSGIPVIFHTTLSDSQTQGRSIQAGAKDFIVKPAARDVLLYRIALHLQLSDYLEKLENTVSALSGIMTESFADLINFRYKMGGHSERVPKLCAVLGRELIRRNIFGEELNPADLSLIIRASPLHDIGNITIPDKVLLKPGPLSEQERNIMKNHSSQGAAILEHFSQRVPTQRFFHYARLIALTHHEAWDGGGYPSGLAEEDIPLCGRLVAVADVYDDITSDRVYRRRLNHEEACRTIVDEKGKRFDPLIVEAFEAVNDEMKEAGVA